MISNFMKIFFFFLVCKSCVYSIQFDLNKPDSEPQYFKQQTDHFNQYNTGSFKQKFYINATYWGGSENLSPIFFGPGGEAPLQGLIYGLGRRFAKELNGIYISVEHRFFGESMPFGSPEASFLRQSDRLGLHNNEQAMADYITMIRALKKQLNCPFCPVVTLGGSYPGCMSAILRYKYPADVSMALAGSAPVFQMSAGLTEQYKFYELITKDAYLADQNCPNAVRQAFSALYQASGEEISKSIPLCQKLSNDKKDGLDQLVFDIVQNFAGLGMSDYPPTKSPMKKACQRIMDGKLDLSAWGRFYNESFTSEGCYDLDAQRAGGTPGASVVCADYSGCGGGYTGEAWDYITCTQFIEDIGTNNITDMFPPRPSSVEQKNQYCKQRFNIETAPYHMESLYGLDYLKQGKNGGFDHIIWSNGAKDPWYVGGVLENLPGENIVIIMPNGAHHSDMYHGDLDNTDPEDTQDVKEARDQEVKIFAKWIDEHRQKIRNQVYLKTKVPQFLSF